MKKLVLELPDEEYEAIMRAAAANHQTPAEYLIAGRHNDPIRGPGGRLSREEEEAAWAVMMSHAGAIDSGDPNSSDNDRIDADLVREYGSSHEGEE